MANNKATEILEGIKTLLFGKEEKFEEPNPTPDPVPAQPIEVALKDGSMIKVSAMEVGGDVMKDDAPAAAGEYELADGKILVVGEDAKIAEIKDAPAPAGTPDPLGLQEQFNALQGEFNAHKEEFGSYKSAFEQKFSEQANTIQKQGEVLNQMFELVKALTEVPAADPLSVEKKSSQFSKVPQKKDTLEKYRNVAIELQKAKDAK